MITKEEFENIINRVKEFYKCVGKVEKIIPNFTDWEIVDFGFKMLDSLLEVCFTKEGLDWIYYYIYENPENCYYLDKVQIPLETVEDLWKLIEPYRK